VSSVIATAMYMGAQIDCIIPFVQEVEHLLSVTNLASVIPNLV